MDGKWRMAIVGTGPIGGIMAAHLKRAGHDVILVDILKDHMDEIKANGLKIEGMEEMTVRFNESDVCASISELKGKDIDAVFISVKASVLPFILPQLEDVVHRDTMMISLQNGMDTEKTIAEHFGAENTVRIVVNYAGNLAGNGRVRISFFNPPNHVGTMTPGAEGKGRELAELITASGLETKFTDEIQKYVWEKVILNSALSPTCALTKKTMKQMMEFPPTRHIVEMILREGIGVAAANGIVYGDDFLNLCMGYLDKAGHHKTSMHVDIERGSPTEITFLNEKIVEYGKLKEIPTPYNSTIVSLIKGLELPEHIE